MAQPPTHVLVAGPDLPGSYLLVIRTRVPVLVAAGHCRVWSVPPGWHLYAGSARRGLHARLRHHLQPLRRPHWHVDRLRQAGLVAEVWAVAGTERQECALAETVAALPGAALHARFGSSDCRCPGHLVSFGCPPPLAGTWPGLVPLRLPATACVSAE